MAKGYLLGNNLVDKTIATIKRVASMPDRQQGDSAYGGPPIFEDFIPRITRGTFTGSWAVGETKAVTYQGSTETISVTNISVPVVRSTAQTTSLNVLFVSCAGTATAVEIEPGTSTCTMVVGGLDLTTLPNYNANAMQVLGHDIVSTAATACNGLRWFDTTACSTAA